MNLNYSGEYTGLVPAGNLALASNREHYRGPADQMHIAMKGGEPRPPFAFAGIWRTWKVNYNGELQEMNVYSMMTTTPNEVMKLIHPSRMPMILDPQFAR